MSDWTVKADEETNRLYINLSGSMDIEEGRKSNEATKAALEELEPGFDVITDIRNFEPGSPEAVELLEEGKEAIAAQGCSAAVRVMPESTMASMHFERVGEEAEAYPVAEAETVEQAEQLLDERRQQEA
jgi:hypothetical protein